MDRRATFGLAVGGLACLLMGLGSLAAPESAAGGVGYEFASPGGAAEFSAVYGGFFAGYGIFLGAAARVRSWRPGAAALLLISAAAAALGRLVGIVGWGAEDPMTFGLLGFEVTATVLGGFVCRWVRAEAESPTE